MTNLEYYKDEIYEMQRDLFENKDICVSRGVGIAICDVYEKYKGVHAFMPMVLDWLLEEHKEPIKLKQWEKDLLEKFNNSQFFDYVPPLFKMKDEGYFKGVADTSMTLKEILDNCEVIENE